MKKEIIKPLVDAGLSQQKIADKLKVSRTTVRHYLEKYNLKTEAIKQCAKCKKRKSTKNFYLRIVNNDTSKPYPKCKTCLLEDKVTAYQLAKQDAIDYKGGSCSICGYSKCNNALEFHHIDPKNKKEQVSKLIGRRVKIKELREELDKCILVCSNCHREIHAGLISSSNI